MAVAIDRGTKAGRDGMYREQIYVLGIPVIVGFLMGWTGANSLEKFAPPVAVLGGIVVAVVGWLTADVGTRCVVALAGKRKLPMLVAFPLGILISGPVVVPATFLVYELFLALGLGNSGIEALTDYSATRALQAFVAPALFWTAVNIALVRFGIPRFGYAKSVAAMPETLVGGPAYAALLDALKPGVRGEVTALHAEQHYVRVYTTRGEDLIHFRFSDAVAAVAHLGGAQVHRSWWVARGAVKHIDGRTLVMVDGSEVPIGRTYTLDARRAGLGD